MSVTLTPTGGGGGKVVLLRIIGGGCVARFSTSWPYFRPKHFPHPFYDLTSKIHTSFQTWRQSQNATYMITKTESRSSLLRWERQQKYIYIYFLKFILNSHIMGLCYSPAGRSVLWETVPEVLNTARGRRPRAALRPTADRPRPVNNIFIFFLLRFKSFRKILLQPPTYVCWRRARSCWCYSKRAIDCKPKQNITTWFLTCNLYYHN